MGHIELVEFQGRHAGATSFIGLEDADFLVVQRNIEKIEACIDARMPEEARLLLAQLVFDFQPLIAEDSCLLSTVLSLLDQCGASALKQRLLVATGTISMFG